MQNDIACTVAKTIPHRNAQITQKPRETAAWPYAHQWIERQAARTPNAIAIVGQDAALTYGELETRANQLAHILQTRGVGPEICVGIYLERSIEQIIVLLAILKAGGAYVPLDPTYPEERIQFMVEDSGIRVLVKRTTSVDLRLNEACSVVVLGQVADELAAMPTIAPTNNVGPQNAAYMIYTSGSTGRPKGVLIEHRSLLNFTEQAIPHYTMTASDRVLQCSSLSWDTSVEEIFPCLASGGTLILRTPNMLDTARGFWELCRAWRLTVLNLTSAFWHELMFDASRTLINELPDLRLVIIGGERVNPECVAIWHETLTRPVRLMNTYGTSEATAITTTFDLSHYVERLAGAEVPIGTPFPNITTHILDEQLKPVPIGTVGSLYIGGMGLARCYHNDAALTASKFIPDPWSDKPGARLYRTGDLARYRADGAIEFLGRLDHQVKIRGYRIALGEIEMPLGLHPSVRHALVLVREDQPGEKRIVAYVVPQENKPFDIAALRAHVGARLPAYMCPSAYVVLAALPLTPNGKINRRVLPAPSENANTSVASWITPTERMLAEIWSELLGVKDPARDANFFELGGHSLLAMRLLTRLNGRVAAPVSLSMLRAYPTIEMLAKAIDGRLQAEMEPAVDFDAEAQLDPALHFDGPRRAGQIRTVLLTGATGFLGAFLLAELLRQTEATIVCLVRARSADECHARITRSLAQYGIDGLPLERVEALPGDLAQPWLGLDESTFAALAQRIDVIYHNGAAVNFVYPYAALRAPNVQGTVEVLRLAGMGEVKPVHFVSTLAVAEVGNGASDLVREATSLPTLPTMDHDSGYVQSKWVAERLVMEAQRRGVPATIHRPDRIAADTSSGASNNVDFFYRFLAGCVALRAVPLLDIRERMIPVDYVSKAIVHISRQPKALGQAFHFFHHEPLALRAIVEELHTRVNSIMVLPYAAWRTLLLETVLANPEHQLSPFVDLFPPDATDLDGLGFQTAIPVEDCGTRKALEGSGIVCPPLDAGVVIDSLSTCKMSHSTIHEEKRRLANE